MSVIPLTFDGRPLEHNTRMLRQGVHKRFACTVCGVVYRGQADAAICCGAVKYEAGNLGWWPNLTRWRPHNGPLGRLNGEGEFIPNAPKVIK